LLFIIQKRPRLGAVVVEKTWKEHIVFNIIKDATVLSVKPCQIELKIKNEK